MTAAVQLAFGACQRWWEREGVLVADNEPFRWDQGWSVEPIDRAAARTFTNRHHYLATLPVNRRCFGLHARGGQLVGVAVYGVPANYAVFEPLGCPNEEALELSRLVLLDGVPCNGESAFVSRCHDALRKEGFAGVISFSDPQPRTTEAGETIMPGHIGLVYQSLSAVYLGRGKARVIRMLPDGQAFHGRAVQKIRAQEKGWERAVEKLRSYGAGPLVGDPVAWLKTWVPRLTRAVSHPGNHKYAFGLHRAVRKTLPGFNPAEYPVPPAGRVAARWGERALRAA